MTSFLSEAQFLKKLRDLGVRKRELADLYNGANDYDQALPMILDLFPRIKDVNQKLTQGLRQGLIRSLAVPASKKLPELWPRLMKWFHACNDVDEKWVVANTLQVVMKATHLEEVLEILGDARHGSAREPFCRAIRKLHSTKVIPPLLAALREKRVRGKDPEGPYGEVLSPAHPIKALGWVAGKEVIPRIEPFLKNCYPGTTIPDDLVRNESVKAIRRIRARG